MTQDELLKKREQVLLKLMEDPMYQPMRLQDIAVFLDVPKSKRKDLESALDALVREGRIRVSRTANTVSPRVRKKRAFSRQMRRASALCASRARRTMSLFPAIRREGRCRETRCAF